MDRDLLRRIYQWSAVLSGRPSSPGELHPEALTKPCLSLSTHTARVIHEELPPFATISRFLLLPVDQHDRDANDLPPSLHGHYSASSLLQGSPPLNSASVLSPSWFFHLWLFRLHRSLRFPRSVQLPHGKLRPPLVPDAAPSVSRYRRSLSHSSYKTAVLDIFYNVSTLHWWFPCGPLLACHLTR